MGLVVVPTLYDDESSISAWIKSKFPLAQKRCLELTQSQSRLESGTPESSRHLFWAKRAGFRAGLTLGPQAATVEYRGKTLGGTLSFA